MNSEIDHVIENPRMTLRETAEWALAALRGLRLQDTRTAIKGLDQVRIKIANDVQDHKRATAWLAVCAIAQALDKTPTALNVNELWNDAIFKVTVWRDAL
jgi:hypothetical protein